VARQVVAAGAAQPDPALILHQDPTGWSLWQAARYVLRVPTNLVLIAASSVGYFFLSGLRTFAVVFAVERYGLSHAAISGLVPVLGLGALAGVLGGGRLADALVPRQPNARVLIPAVAYTATALLLLPALLTSLLALALPALLLAAASLAAANPPLDAARLDIMHCRLWGRAESVRTFLRTGAEALAPVLFGVLADLLRPARGAAGQAVGLQRAFLIMLVALLANGVILLRALRTYGRDVATAMASERETARAGMAAGPPDG
jgi:MFS family permease